LLRLADGEPITSGIDDDQSVVVRTDAGSLQVVRRAEADPSRVIRHDPHATDPSQQFAIARLDGPSMAHVPVGIFRDVTRPTYDDLVREQVDHAVSSGGGAATDDDIAALLAGSDTWTVNDRSAVGEHQTTGA
jgi:2-oxoglutarate/2-oxoacid ferredoxin oxidoreductase subunit beta